MRASKHPTLKEFVIRAAFQPKRTIVKALSNVTFSVEAASMLGIIGQNGCGKTTLLRLIAGILKPDSGNIAVDGTVGAVLSLGSGFHPDLTGRENARVELLAQGFSRRQTESYLPEVAHFADIGEFFDAPMRTYSAGMTMRLGFACAICIDPDILLLDEVLAVGDEAFSLKCLDAITSFRSRGKTIVLVTHNAAFVEEWCDTALWLDHGHIAGLGDPRAVVAAYHALSDQRPAPVAVTV